MIELFTLVLKAIVTRAGPHSDTAQPRETTTISQERGTPHPYTSPVPDSCPCLIGVACPCTGLSGRESGIALG